MLPLFTSLCTCRRQAGQQNGYYTLHNPADAVWQGLESALIYSPFLIKIKNGPLRKNHNGLPLLSW